jgi:hypothetical protein
MWFGSPQTADRISVKEMNSVPLFDAWFPHAHTACFKFSMQFYNLPFMARSKREHALSSVRISLLAQR